MLLRRRVLQSHKSAHPHQCILQSRMLQSRTVRICSMQLCSTTYKVACWCVQAVTSARRRPLVEMSWYCMVYVSVSLIVTLVNPTKMTQPNERHIHVGTRNRALDRGAHWWTWWNDLYDSSDVGCHYHCHTVATCYRLAVLPKIKLTAGSQWRQNVTTQSLRLNSC